MTIEEFRKYGHQTVDWMADYYEGIEDLPVKSQVNPGEILAQIPDSPPNDGEPYTRLIEDVDNKIIPGMTHWQHPNFHAYFPGNSSFPSVLAEMITATISAQCMVWDTSPAAAELEEKMMEWLKEMMHLPANWDGVIQDTASTGTLVALLSAREKLTDFEVNESGFPNRNMRIYCSSETHSSIDKAVKMAGFGRINLIKIDVDDQNAMRTDLLKQRILKDIEDGKKPCAVVSTIGTTGTMGIDPVKEISQICEKHGIWHHIDAAYAGSMLILPEYQYLTEGFEKADSFLFNPHKWLFVNFDCSAYFVREKDVLLKTFEILPEYLKTKTRGKVHDYRDWGIQLGRRFRALKLWFVIRSFGVNGLRDKIRGHIDFAKWFESRVDEDPDFENVISPGMSMVIFRLNPSDYRGDLDELNERFLHEINNTGQAYLTHTRYNGMFVLRLVTAQTYLKKVHIEKLWDLIKNISRGLL